MDELTREVLFFIGFFIIIFLVDYLLKKKKIKSKKKKKVMEIDYLVDKFHLDKNKLNVSKMIIIISLINAFIIALVIKVVLVCRINIILQLGVGFLLLLGLIYGIYELYGRYLVKVGYSKNGK